MIITKFRPGTYTHALESGVISYEAPSNIALVKYWGKHGCQLPKNPSVSFTLDSCKTTTNLHFKKRNFVNAKGFDFKVLLEGRHQPDFEPKIEQFFSRIEGYLPFLSDYSFTIETSNSFPHSSGIASSASGMSALALCLMEMEKQLLPAISIPHFNEKASFISRLGSGSACRSIQGPLVVWGEHQDVRGSSDLFGVRYPHEVHPDFTNYQDTILLVDKGEKQVSSTVGHNLMKNHPYAHARFEQAHDHLSKLIPIFKTGDLEGFVNLVELEALTLHAMMMTSNPYFILMKPNTLKIIEKTWEYRRETNNQVCFTLDAGANVHLLYPNNIKIAVQEWVRKELTQFCQKNQYIFDNVGSGARKL